MSKLIFFPGQPQIRLQRNQWGVFQIEAPNEADLYRGLAYVHAMDRGMQLLVMRILGKGQGSQFLVADQAMLEIDLFFRRMNWAGQADAELAKLSPASQALCQAYCEGLNQGLKKSVPWELKLMGYKPDPWTPADCILLSRMTGYISLSQSQAEVEALLVQMVKNQVPREHLEEFFGPLPDLDIDLVRQLKHSEAIVPEAVRWNLLLPKLIASNNWVISGSKTRSGQPILANDPHLEGNRLPNVWYEAILKCPDYSLVAATMPGLPGALLGRSPDLAWGATYTFMDAVDSWIEEVKDGKYRRDLDGQTQWHDFKIREEIIQRKGKEAHVVRFYENDHGTLQHTLAGDGYYLSTCWASGRSGGVSLNQISQMPRCKDVQAGMDCLGQLETSWNWVFADSSGNIGYQMSGLMPRRHKAHSGLMPVPGWLPENDWQGFVPHTELPRAYNPEQGYFVSANNDLNQWGQAQPINMPMGSYRADRIAQVLESSDQLSVRDCQQLQLDRFSLQAQAYLGLWLPLLPDTPTSQILLDWDCCYEVDSQGAFVFEQIYRALIQLVFGELNLGADVANTLLNKTGIFADFYANVDRILMAEDSVWFQGKSREELYRQAIASGLAVEPKPWGQHNQFVMKHLLLGGKLPAFMGFDRGPIEIPGGRATPQQGQIYRAGERQTSFVPSIRVVTDFASEGVHSCLLGGPSDRPFSKWYDSELKAWQTGDYKYLSWRT